MDTTLSDQALESATQIDLARGEAPASQVLSSALAQPDHSSNNQSPRGSITATHQVRSYGKKSRGSNGGADAAIPLLDADAFGESDNVVELQPMDGGFGAWSYVASAFFMYIVVWGFPQAFPIFQTYLSNGPKARFPESVAIRLLAPGIQDIEEGILFQLLPKHSRYRRLLVVVGIFIIVVSVVLASYATTDWQVVLTQGVTFGIGGILLNFVHVSVFSEWFDAKKGQAMGIIWTGWRVGALFLPLVCQWLLEENGFEKTLRVLIPGMLTLLAPSILLLRGRYHSATVSSQPPQPQISKFQALREPSVLYYLLATSVFALVMNVPKMFITTFAADLGLNAYDQATTLVLLVLGDMLSTYLFGWLSDTYFHEALTGSLALATGAAHIFGLGLARSRLGVVFYALGVGLTSGGYYNCLFTFYGEAAKGSNELFTAIHSIFSLFSGAAILSVGPIGAILLNKAPSIEMEEFAIAKYRYLLIYAAGASCLSGCMILAKYGRARVAGTSK